MRELGALNKDTFFVTSLQSSCLMHSIILKGGLTGYYTICHCALSTQTKWTADSSSAHKVSGDGSSEMISEVTTLVSHRILHEQ